VVIVEHDSQSPASNAPDDEVMIRMPHPECVLVGEVGIAARLWAVIHSLSGT
jgi:hypothetical protein